jgi:hypothetical protein
MSRRSRGWCTGLTVGALVLAVIGCRGGERREASGPGGSYPRALALGLAVFAKSPDGKQVPQPATAGFLRYAGGRWEFRTLVDEESNVFHKVMEYHPPGGEPGLLTLGGTAAAVKLWRKGRPPVTVWKADFGGKFSRMRDGELEDLDRDGVEELAVGTHDQGVVAVVRPDGTGGFAVRELDRAKDTFIHEIEVGDLDGDGALEVYATPSLPNRLDGTPQPGEVVRYVPAGKGGRTVVAALGDQHAKEILVADVDGDGREELYAAVEAVSGGRVKIRRYDGDTPPDAGAVIASLDDRLCRVLLAGDVDGDGRREMVAAGSKSGLWLMRPGGTRQDPWEITSIDRASSGFEHASLLADLDGDGRDELYAASDDDHEVRRYTWAGKGAAPVREVIHRYGSLSGFTWNITTVSASLVP